MKEQPIDPNFPQQVVDGQGEVVGFQGAGISVEKGGGENPNIPGTVIVEGHEQITEKERPKIFEAFELLLKEGDLSDDSDERLWILLSLREQLGQVTNRQDLERLFVTADKMVKSIAESDRVSELRAQCRGNQLEISTKFQGIMVAFGLGRSVFSVGASLSAERQYSEQLRQAMDIPRWAESDFYAIVSNPEISFSQFAERIQQNKDKRNGLLEGSQGAKLKLAEMRGLIEQFHTMALVLRYLDDFKVNISRPSSLSNTLAADQALLDQAGGSEGNIEELANRMIKFGGMPEINHIEAGDMLMYLRNQI